MYPIYLFIRIRCSYIEYGSPGVPPYRDSDLHVSASDCPETGQCNGKWGRRYFPSLIVDPKVYPVVGNACMARVSFLSKVSDDSDAYLYAKNGALNFTLTLGDVDGWPSIAWNGLYNGHGGP